MPDRCERQERTGIEMAQPELDRQPNIVLINCDDLGYGDLGCYGSKVNRTPALDKMAAEGILFTDFYMASPVCSPSRGAMLTGCYPPRIGFGSFEGRAVLFPGQAVGLNPREITIARLLQEAGYATKLVGKWHCGDQPPFLPTRHGFDSYFGLPYSNDMGRQKPADTYPPLPLMRDERVVQQQPDQSSLTARYVEESLDFIHSNAKKPFFLYLAHMHVHRPIYPDSRFLRESANGRYGAAVAGIDWSALEILRAIERLGLEQNTLVVFTSDNGSRCRDGGGSNGILRGTKATTWEGGQRVPCIMRWSGMIPAGSVCRKLATAMDFYPTFAALGRALIPRDRIIDGRNILPLMASAGTAESPHDCFFYYMKDDLEAVRNRRWKLHVRKNGQPIRELYDLENDPGETRNLLDANAGVARELKQRLDACRLDLGDAASGVTGRNVRPAGRVDNPDTLTHLEPGHPYNAAMYDLDERG